MKKNKLSYESDGKMGQHKGKKQSIKNTNNEKMFFNTTQNSE
ncbi:hypothetical protein [Metabacillus niabensis]|nr:hypothetical protein [Metabacillus niabensis]